MAGNRKSVANNDFVVYCHISPSKKRYVGISCNPQNRWGKNGRNYKKNYRFYRAIQKYGWDNIEHIILFSGLTIDQAKQIEIKLIARWKLTDFNYGYNLRDGGDGTFSAESLQKMSKSRIGNKNSAGHHHDEEMKRKISEGLIRYYAEHPKPIKDGKKRRPKKKTPSMPRNYSGANNPSARPLNQYTKEGVFVANYPYMKKVCELFGYDLSTITKCCKGKLEVAYGYKWFYGVEQLELEGV